VRAARRIRRLADSFAATAILVTHPGGDFLVDAGFGAGIAAHVHAQPWYARSPYQASGTASEQLR
jgi:N-acyl homoserine lactone hydrolase